jgi:hypothetical protein
VDGPRTVQRRDEKRINILVGKLVMKLRHTLGSTGCFKKSFTTLKA